MGALLSLPRTFPTTGARVIVVHREHLVRDALRALLQRGGLSDVVACVVEEIHDLARPDNFNVLLVVLDGHATHDATLLDTVAELKTITSTILVLSEHTGRSQIDEAYRLPHCVVLQDRPGSELTDLVARTCSEIRGATATGQRMHPGPETTAAAEAATQSAGVSALTFFERRLVAFIGRGLPLSEIARTLQVPDAEARQCLFQVLDKLGMSDRVQLAAYITQTNGQRSLPSTVQ
jgi:DNA-binding NarL/FixJ family response regulator